MKKIAISLFMFSFLLFNNNVSAQQWSGPNNTTSTISRTGKVAMGFNYGISKLAVDHSSNTEWALTAFNAGGSGGAAYIKSGFHNNPTPIFRVEAAPLGPMSDPGALRFLIRADGKVGVGTENLPGDHLLYVAGTAIAEEVIVKLEANWPDFVFKSNYNLMSLAEVEKYIEENNHLPNVPSEKEVIEEGIALGEMDAKLLRKVEELTLYVIQLKKEIEILKEEVK